MFKITKIEKPKSNCDWCNKYFGYYTVYVYSLRLFNFVVEYWDYSRNNGQNGQIKMKSHIYIKKVIDGFIKYEKTLNL